MLQAVVNDSRVKVLQSPQLRAMDNLAASVSVGSQIPEATGSYGTGLAAGVSTVSPLVSTQFTYVTVGVTVKLQARVHDNDEVSMHVSVEVSSQSGTVTLGGISEPVISKDQIEHDVRLKEGEVSLLGGLLTIQDTKTVTGVPGLSSIPLLGKLFTGQSTDRQESELMIALAPHIVRNPEFSPLNLRTIDVGTQNATKLNYAPLPSEEAEKKAPAPAIEITPPSAPSAAPSAAAPAPGAQPVSPAAGAAPVGALPQALQQLIRPGVAGPPGAPGMPAPTGAAVARFAPPSVEIAANGAFTVALMLDGATDVVSAQPIQIQYNPKLLTLTDISPGDLFSRDGQQPVFARNIANDQGVGTVQSLARPAGAPGVSGSGSLLLLRFQALAPGTAVVGALNVTARNSQGWAVGSSSPQLAVTIK
jgi:general secretion pathway protein D